MKKILLFSLSAIAIVLFALTGLLKSSWLFERTVPQLLRGYDIGYDDLKGDLYDGFDITRPTYKDEEMASTLHIRWNLLSLFRKEIAIENLSVEELNISGIRKIVASIPSEKGEASGKDRSFPFPVRVDRCDISFSSFKEKEFSFGTSRLRSKGLHYNNEGVEIDGNLTYTLSSFAIDDIRLKRFVLEVGKSLIPEAVWEKNDLRVLRTRRMHVAFDSNVGRLRLDAHTRKDSFEITDIDLSGIDIEKIKTLVDASQKPSSGSSQPKEDHTIHWKLPKYIVVKHAHTDVKSFVMKPMHLGSAEAVLESIRYDTLAKSFRSGILRCKGTTNLTDFVQWGRIVDNRFEGNVTLTPKRHLFEHYALPLRKEAIGDIDMNISLSRQALHASLFAKARNVYVSPNETNATEYIVDIDGLRSEAVFYFDDMRLEAETEANITTPYTKKARLTNRMRWSESGLHYRGDADLGHILLSDTNLSRMFEGMHFKYRGNETSFDADLRNRYFKGKLSLPDFNETGRFTLESLEPLPMASFVSLPEPLHASRAEIDAIVPIDMREPLPLRVHVGIDSDLVVCDIDAAYDNALHMTSRIRLPSDSLLYTWQHDVVWESLFPVDIDVNSSDAESTLLVHAKRYRARLDINGTTYKTKGKLRFSGIDASVEGIPGDAVVVMADIDDFKTLFNGLKGIYRFDRFPDIEGSLYTAVTIEKNRGATLHVTAPEIVYRADRKTKHTIDGAAFSVRKKGDRIVVDAYNLMYNGMRFYGTKSSVLTVKKEHWIPDLWVNDSLHIGGEVDTKRMQGALKFSARRFAFTHPYVDLNASVNVTANLEGNATDVEGKIVLSDTEIKYDISKKTFPSDSDIVIVQEQKDAQSNPLWDNTTVLIDVETERPIRYRTGPIDIRATADLIVNKPPMSDINLLGRIDILDGSSYRFEQKRFVLEKSHIYLTGDLNEPILDLKVKYKALRYLVTVTVSGTPAAPNLIFSSVPHLSKEQILSLILFDSVEAASTNDAEDMMRMMGGAMAKAALNDMGVKIDHLAIGAGNSVEVGEKLTDDIMVIYINGEMPEVKMRYEYNPHVDVVFGASEKSQSADIIYRNDLSRDEDIVVIFFQNGD